MRSSYKDGAGFDPGFISEVKTALQEPEQLTLVRKKVILALRAAFEPQQRIGENRENERKVRVITIAHNAGLISIILHLSRLYRDSHRMAVA